MLSALAQGAPGNNRTSATLERWRRRMGKGWLVGEEANGQEIWVIDRGRWWAQDGGEKMVAEKDKGDRDMGGAEGGADTSQQKDMHMGVDQGKEDLLKDTGQEAGDSEGKLSQERAIIKGEAEWLVWLVPLQQTWHSRSNTLRPLMS